MPTANPPAPALNPESDVRPPGDTIAPFEELYRGSSDPWGTTTRWYERRKRALLLATLTRERYGSVYEAGCGTGHISVALAGRCDRLLASDASPRALAIAMKALADCRNATLACHRLPDDWPDDAFDLTVLSEVLYFIADDACDRVAAAARRNSGATGTVVACDWRDAIEGRGISGEDAHRRFEGALGLPRLFEYIDRDFVLTGWSADGSSTADREGLR